MMEAHVEDFLTGMLDDCIHLMDRWRRRHPPGLDWALAGLTCWEGLAQALPADPATLDLDCERFRVMRTEARALALLRAAGPTGSGAMPALVERLYGVLEGPGEPAQAFAAPARRRAVANWAARHATPPGLPQSAMALVDFVQLAPLAACNVQAAALLASVLPTWAGAPIVHVLPPEGRAEEGFVHALDAACEGEDGAWIAYYLGRARRALKRLPVLLDGVEAIRGRWVGLLGPALGEAGARRAAASLLAHPVVTPDLLGENALPPQQLAEAVGVLFGAGEAVEMHLSGECATLLPAPLRLLLA